MVSGRIKALIVDDDPFIREMVTAILEGEGYEVETAENGGEAFTKFCADSGIGIVVSDMNMPGISGLELIRKIRDQGSDVPAIILSGDEGLSLAAGDFDVLVKDENIQETIGPRVGLTLSNYRRKKESGPRQP